MQTNNNSSSPPPLLPQFALFLPPPMRREGHHLWSCDGLRAAPLRRLPRDPKEGHSRQFPPFLSWQWAVLLLFLLLLLEGEEVTATVPLFLRNKTAAATIITRLPHSNDNSFFPFPTKEKKHQRRKKVSLAVVPFLVMGIGFTYLTLSLTLLPSPDSFFVSPPTLPTLMCFSAPFPPLDCWCCCGRGRAKST